jgi:aminoglycoside phosphotransferase (APT) family kinase protein
MSRRPPAAVLWENLASHPAVAAWRQIAQDSPDPEPIEVLRQGKKSATYRLVGAGPDGAPIIAQRSHMAKARIERTLYEEVLPHLPVTSPRYYGFREESPGFGWLFLEDVGDERYSATDQAHQALAGRWLGLMHTTAARVAAAHGLPDGGPRRYLDHLQAGSRTIHANLAKPALTAADVTTLRRLVADLDGLEQRWTSIERACTGVPATLAHGDFQRKNAYIRIGASGPELFAIDWETAGWGVPAVDLTRIDLGTYWSVVHPCWRDVRLEDVQRLAAVGRIFEQLAAIRWVSPELSYDTGLYLRRPMSWLRVFHDRLADAALELGRCA